MKNDINIFPVSRLLVFLRIHVVFYFIIVIVTFLLNLPIQVQHTKPYDKGRLDEQASLIIDIDLRTLIYNHCDRSVPFWPFNSFAVFGGSITFISGFIIVSFFQPTQKSLSP